MQKNAQYDFVFQLHLTQKHKTYTLIETIYRFFRKPIGGRGKKKKQAKIVKSNRLKKPHNYKRFIKLFLPDLTLYDKYFQK